MYAPEVAGFSSGATGKLQVVPVKVCTMFADGPRPIAYSPPKYSDIVKVEDEPETRYNPISISGFIPSASKAKTQLVTFSLFLMGSSRPADAYIFRECLRRVSLCLFFSTCSP